MNQTMLKELLNYDQNAGVFTWLKAGQGRRVGQVAGGIIGSGYRQIRFLGKMHYAHRLAWLYVFGNMPSGQIDHIDGDRLNNRINNLRCATNAQNTANSRIKSSNTSGYKGVSWSKEKRHWRVHVGRAYIGFYTCKIDAAKAYNAAAIEHFGEFANLNIIPSSNLENDR